MAKIGGGGLQLLQFSICYMTLYEFKKKCLLREKVGAPPHESYVSEMTLKDK